MSKEIIKKETTEYGSIEIQFIRRDEGYTEIMRFDSELQLKAFAYLLKMMVESDASSVSVG